MTSLILLAAGASKRFGRPKQLEPVGPHGETVMELTLRDAWRNGCSHAVLVIRPEHEVLFAEKFGADARVRCVVQPVALGTGHAVMIGMKEFDGTAVVANADDHYGEVPVAMAFAHAVSAGTDHALIAFALGNTLSENGPVNRALCMADADGFLTSTEEREGLQGDPVGKITDAGRRLYDPSTLVSMNLWVLRNSIEPHFRDAFDRYEASGQQGELGLPTVVQQAVSAGQRVRVLRTDARWAGLTYATDADIVRRSFLEGDNTP